ncbi:nucleotidyltransferase [Acinetobacter phage ZZ1]|jgi:hypothetical protein|uniref:Nucleotidyltransferase n=2 Tax=Caudoviricetes TaxID=2731619 RepID=I3WVC7_9CAUD|nr:nucleotidyltransferase [Acinetobacter phage ZZ1]AFL47447.1 hypothetical protein ZZ1p0133 [Acinetobacter phage ZZ1]
MRLIMKTVFGSALYGTQTPESDTDIKGIFIPGARDLILGNPVEHYLNNTAGDNVKNTANDVDEEMYSLKQFIAMAVKGETIALDMLHSNTQHIIDYDYMEPWDFIYNNRHRFYTTDMKAYLGYVKKQASKYGIKGTRMAALREVWEIVSKEEVGYDRPSPYGWKSFTLDRVIDKLPQNEYCFTVTNEDTGQVFYEVLGAKHQLTVSLASFVSAIKKQWEKYGARARQAELNQGVDWKSMHHAIRGGFQLQEIYKTGDLQYPLKDAKLLLDIKLGKLSFKEVSEILEDTISDVDRLAIEASKNGMPAEVDTKFWDKFIEDVYLEQIKLEYKLK